MQKARPSLEDGHLELDNNMAERAVKPVATAFTLIETAKLNNVDPQPGRIWVLDQIADHWITRLDELLPWRYATRAA